MQNHYTVLNILLAKLLTLKNSKRVGVKEIALITVTHEYNPGYEKHVLYFYSKHDQIILPINLYDNKIENILSAAQKTFLPTQNIYNAAKTFVSLLKGKITGVTIYAYKSGTYYSRVLLETVQNTFEIEVQITDALGLALAANVPMYAQTSFLKDFGFQVTKELVRKAIDT